MKTPVQTFISRLAQRAKPYTLSIALACAITAAAGVAWAQTRINPTGVGVSGSVIGDDVLYSIGGGRAVPGPRGRRPAAQHDGGHPHPGDRGRQRQGHEQGGEELAGDVAAHAGGRGE